MDQSESEFTDSTGMAQAVGSLPAWDFIRVVDFASRAKRSEYWAVQVVAALFLVLVLVLFPSLDFNIGLVLVVIAFPTVVYVVCGASVNRAHDIGHSGWQVVAYMVPLAGFILALYLGIRPGEPSPNSWGPTIR